MNHCSKKVLCYSFVFYRWGMTWPMFGYMYGACSDVFKTPILCRTKEKLSKTAEKKPTLVPESDLFKFRILFSAKYTSSFISKVLTDNLLNSAKQFCRS